MKADLIVKNGKIVTVNDRFDIVSAVAVAGETVIAAGSDEEMEQYRKEDTVIINLQGKTMLPGANDSHMHGALTGHMLAEEVIDFRKHNITSIKEMQEVIAEYAAKIPEGKWLFGMGYMEYTLKEMQENPDRHLNCRDIDKACGTHPVMFMDFGAHNVLVNSKALQIAEAKEAIPDVPEHMGKIERFPDGSPSGVFSDWGAQAIIGRYCEKLSDDEIEAAIIRLQRYLNSQGITSHTDILGIGGNELIAGLWSERVIHIYEKLAREGKLTASVSIGLLPALHMNQNLESVQTGLEKMKLPDFGNKELVKAETIKLFGDSVNWHREYQEGDSRHGRSAFPGSTDAEQEKEMKNVIRFLHQQGWQIEIHAIGGKTIETAITGFAEAEREFPGKEKKRHILIHADELLETDLDKVKENEIIIAPQPLARQMMAQFMPKGLEVYSYSSCFEKGIKVTGGSDSYIFDASWLKGAAAALRTAEQEKKQCTIEDILRMYTINGAYQEHMERSRGSIEIGKKADFQILNRDILNASPKEIEDISVEAVIFRGKVVYEKEKCRCSWALQGKEMQEYHDKEWGRPLHDDRKLFELMILEMFQEGLSWNLVLKRRERLRAAMDNFDYDVIAAYTDEKIQELMQDERVIRNRKKLEAMRKNAVSFQKIREEYGSFHAYLWGFVKGKPIHNQIRSMEDMPAKTELSAEISKDMKKKGFCFMGPVVVYSFIQSAGLVNDHFISCYCYKEIQSDEEKGNEVCKSDRGENCSHTN